MFELKHSEGQSTQEKIQWITNYLKMMIEMKREHCRQADGYEYFCVEEFILKWGRPFEYKPEMNDFEKMKAKGCFSNAFNTNVDNDNLWYAEGIAFRDRLGLPLEHAWCVNRKGQVYEPTWNYYDGEMLWYFGIALRKGFASEQILKYQYYGIIFNFNKRLPLLKKGSFHEKNIAWRLKDVKTGC